MYSNLLTVILFKFSSLFLFLFVIVSNCAVPLWWFFSTESIANAERISAERLHAERLAIANDPVLRLQMAGGGHPGGGAPHPSTHTHAHSHTHLHLHQAESAAAALLQAQAGIPPSGPPGIGHPPPPPPIPGKLVDILLTTVSYVSFQMYCRPLSTCWVVAWLFTNITKEWHFHRCRMVMLWFSHWGGLHHPSTLWRPQQLGRDGCRTPHLTHCNHRQSRMSMMTGSQ